MKKYHNITIYTEPSNKLCELAKAFFRDQGVDYVECDISKDKSALAADMNSKDKKQEVPVVDIDGRLIVGYHPELYESALK